MKASLGFSSVLLLVYNGCTSQQFVFLILGGELVSDLSNGMLLLSGHVVNLGEVAGFNS